MKITIRIECNGSAFQFKTARAAIKFVRDFRADKIFLNNEACGFRDIAELYQLELKERRHNKAQGL